MACARRAGEQENMMHSASHVMGTTSRTSSLSVHNLSWASRWLGGKETACQCRRCRRCGFNPWVRKIPWIFPGNGNPLQYSCLGNPMDRGAWWATVHGVAKSRIQLSDWTTTILRPLGRLTWGHPVCLGALCPEMWWDCLKPFAGRGQAAGHREGMALP